MQTKLLIEGELVAGEGSALDILGPASGETVTNVCEASPQQVAVAMKDSGNGCDMPVHSLDACTAIRHVMVAHA